MDNTTTMDLYLDEVEVPPTEEELPYDDGVPVESQQHYLQIGLLIETLDRYFLEQGNVFVGGNMFVYFDIEQTRGRYFRGPDVFVVKGVSRRMRRSWVVWQEGKGPDVVIELLSPSTLERDKGEKKQVYQDQLRVPEYFWHNPFGDDLAGFVLREGVYEPIVPEPDGALVSQQLQLKLVRWSGVYRSNEMTWLRWATLDGTILPTGAEDAEQAQQAAEAERQAAQQAQQVAQQAQQVAQQAQQAAEAERQAAQQAQARAAELEAQLARYRAQFGDIEE